MNFAQSRPSTAQHRLRVAVLAVSCMRRAEAQYGACARQAEAKYGACMRRAEARYAAVAQVIDVDAIESMQAQASCRTDATRACAKVSPDTMKWLHRRHGLEFADMHAGVLGEGACDSPPWDLELLPRSLIGSSRRGRTPQRLKGSNQSTSSVPRTCRA